MAEHTDELTEYFTELTHTDVREYMRRTSLRIRGHPAEYLQHGGGRISYRLVLAATLGASYGIYSGYELARTFR